jgi:DNA-directed RNA polymerase subunit E"
MVKRACKLCKRIVMGNLCPACKTTELTRNWKGILIVMNPESDLAKEAKITAPGKYAVRVK